MLCSLNPSDRSFVWASNCAFHLVNDSGMVKLNVIFPSASVFRSGKKKAVSEKFLRT